jgi:hypothetical protein
MIDTSTFAGLSEGNIVNQHTGCADDYARFLAARCDAHVQVWIMRAFRGIQ